MKLPSARDLHREIDGVYAMGLFVTLATVTAKRSGDAHSSIMLLKISPIILTAALVIGHGLVAKREEARSRSGREGYQATGRPWLVPLAIYTALALILAFWISFDSGIGRLGLAPFMSSLSSGLPASRRLSLLIMNLESMPHQYIQRQPN